MANRKRFIAALFFAIALAAVAIPAAGQDVTPRDVAIRKLSYTSTRTPEYNARTRGQLRERIRDWGEITCIYETQPEFINELEFTYYVIMKTKDPREPFVLLKGGITYVYIPKGRTQSTMYLHPSVLERFGTVEGVAVEIRAGGRLIAVETDGPRGRDYQQAIQQLPTRDNHVLPPSHTPFAMLGFDNNEMVKP